MNTDYTFSFYLIYLFIPRKNGNEAGEPYSGTHSSLQGGQEWTLILSPGYPFYAPLTLGKSNFLEFHSLDFDIFKLKPH